MIKIDTKLASTAIGQCLFFFPVFLKVRCAWIKTSPHMSQGNKLPNFRWRSTSIYNGPA